MAKKIGLWLNHGLGDVVMSLPLIRELINEEDELHFFVKGQLQEDLILNTIDLQYNLTFHHLDRRSINIVLSIFQKFDVFLFPHANRGGKYDMLFSLIRASKIVIPKQNSRNLVYHLSKEVEYVCDKEVHKVNYYRSFAQLPDIYEYDILQNKLSPSKIIAISPGSGEVEQHKRLSSLQWAQLIDLIKNQFPEMRIIVFHSHNEIDLFTEIASFCSANIENYIPNSIKDSLSFLKTVQFSIAVCNGASHLASLLNIPCLGIYGPTNPSFTGLFGKRNRIYRLNYKCSPCYRKDYITGCSDNICISHIEPQVLFHEFCELKKGYYYQPNYISNKSSTKPEK